MENNPKQQVVACYHAWSGSLPDSVHAMPPSGSNRSYFRLHDGRDTIIGAYNPHQRENLAFLSLTKAFHRTGLPVPEVLAMSADNTAYLLTDLGDTTLFSLLPHDEQATDINEDIMDLYREAIRQLTRFQLEAPKHIDFSICYPRHAFDRQSMRWDLNYFKYYYLKTSRVTFDEQLLEDDFHTLIAYLSAEPAEYFMYRDFQSRNIMIKGGNPYFIDYQGGRKGPLAYDMASLLFNARANIPFHQREELLRHYIATIKDKGVKNLKSFQKSFYAFVLMRILQALGTYGFRGGVEKKSFFLQSLPYAYNNLEWLRKQGLLPGNLPHLTGVIKKMLDTRPVPGQKAQEQDILPPPDDRLTVRVCSFSYKKGIPEDNSGNGGGFVFDCRALPNPGREKAYQGLTGKDPEVIRCLQEKEEVLSFLESSGKLTHQAVQTYLRRGFTSLAVCFGCTGGQHRSVFCAEQLARKLRYIPDIHVVVHHFEEDNWPNHGN